jgi:hypothetical protein
MKCVKCGYFSFDYLSECKKCRTKLGEERQRLGFSGLRPAIPFMLGSLLRDYEPSENQESEASEVATAGSLDFEERLDDAAPGLAGPENGAAMTPPVIAGVEKAEEDFSLLDLSDEELDLLIDRGTFENCDAQPAFETRTAADDAEFIIPESMSQAGPASPAFKIEPEVGEAQSAEGLDEFELILGPDDCLPIPEEGPSAPPPGMPDSELTLDLSQLEEEHHLAPAEIEALPEPDGQNHGESDDNFVIELSEEDFDNVLVELSRFPKDEAGVETEG